MTVLFVTFLCLHFKNTNILFYLRFEIEKKLRQARKAERAKEKPPSTKYKEKDSAKSLQTDFSSIDHKERSKERKKNIEENRGRVDKRVNAMAELKARREGKQRREEAETARREEQRKKDEEEASISSNKNAVKLKASDIYSDDSESEGEFRICCWNCVFLSEFLVFL